MKLKEVLGRMRTYWNNGWKRYEADMQRWREDDPGSYYAFMWMQDESMKGKI